MIIFWIICALMLAIAIMFIVLPLWRGSSKSNHVQRDGANLEIFRDQISEMDADLRNGLLTQEMYDQGKRELQSRLLDEVGGEQNATPVTMRQPLKILAVALSLLLPMTVVGVYWAIGDHQALFQQENNIKPERFGSAQSVAALKALEEKVAAQPEDAESLFRLARSYSEFERFGDSAQAYDKLTRLIPNEAQLWADYADVLAMTSGQSLLGKPTKLLNKALALNPVNLKALALSGSAAMEREDYAAAVRHWEKLLHAIPADDENVKFIEGGIQQARDLMAQTKGGKSSAKVQAAAGATQSAKEQSAKEGITGTVQLSKSLITQASPEDTLFVLVRAAEGPKMPLAIVRKQVKDLPYNFTLDDSTAMSPQMKVSNFDRVIVIARISKSGNAMIQAGDLQGMSKIIKPGTGGLKITIDQILP